LARMKPSPATVWSSTTRMFQFQRTESGGGVYVTLTYLKKVSMNLRIIKRLLVCIIIKFSCNKNYVFFYVCGVLIFYRHKCLDFFEHIDGGLPQWCFNLKKN
jgi:hypothetical protein